MNELEALRAIEELCRTAVDQLDLTNIAVGECDAKCENIVQCNATIRGTVDCPKCGEKVDFEEDCNGEEVCGVTCNSDVALDLLDEEQDTIRSLRLALVQLDLARTAEVK